MFPADLTQGVSSIDLVQQPRKSYFLGFIIWLKARQPGLVQQFILSVSYRQRPCFEGKCPLKLNKCVK